MKRKISLIIALFLIGIVTCGAYEANLNTNTLKITSSEHFTIQLEITGEQEDISEVQIMGLENFEQLGTSYYQKYSSQMQIINGNNEDDSSHMVNTIILTLKPKSTGKFTIGPAILIGTQENKETNTIELEVIEDTIIPKTESNEETEEPLNISSYLDDNNLYTTQEELTNKYISYFLTFGFLVVILLIFLYLLQRKRLALQVKTICERENLSDFEYDNDEEYPEIEDEDFMYRVENILAKKLKHKYKIKRVPPKSYEMILEEFDDIANKELLTNVVVGLNYLKYSNILVSKAELLENVKKL